MPRELTADEQERTARRQFERAEQLAQRLAGEHNPPAALAAQRRGAFMASSNALASAIASLAEEYEVEATVGIGVEDGDDRVVTVELSDQQVMLVRPGENRWQVRRADPGGAHGRLTELRELVAELEVTSDGGWVPASAVLEKLHEQL